MPAQRLLQRLERAESAAKSQFRFSTDCICFPENEPPFFGFPIEAEIAARVQCPLHGNRFRPMGHLYVSKWRRKSEEIRRQRLSAQYHKAWLASFPSDLWPAEEVETDDGRIFLKLQDGTTLLAYDRCWIPAKTTPTENTQFHRLFASSSTPKRKQALENSTRRRIVTERGEDERWRTL
jgi:hypothetical protein